VDEWEANQEKITRTFMSTEKEIKRVPRQDGKKRMLVVKSGLGNLYRFEEESYVTTEDGYSFWATSHVSGLYDSAEAADRAGRLELPWLREQNPT
jgi:hypothetical protein